MEYVNLGRAGLKVSRLALGTMNFGARTEERESFSVMEKALELGINFFDTADIYPPSQEGKPRGTTEQIVGRWLAQGGRRDRIVLATKVYGRMGDGPNERRLSAYHIRKACEDSLRRLQTDRIDLYQMHHIDRETPWEEIWQAMDILVRQGKVIYVGSSNFAGWHLAQSQGIAERLGMLGIASEQGLYNLRTRTAELEVLPACRALGIGFLPWSPLSGGLLAGNSARAANGRSATEPIRKEAERNKQQLESYESFCRRLGASPANVALSWLLHNPTVTSPILGPRTVDQLTGSLKALEIRLGAEEMEWLDRLWPGPGGEAPEAYAW
jgi:aryl-alcohol dehydrogenase-like predicted oxidoreductase